MCAVWRGQHGGAGSRKEGASELGFEGWVGVREEGTEGTAPRGHRGPGEGRVCYICSEKPLCGPQRGYLRRALTSRVKDFEPYSEATEVHGGVSDKAVTVTAMF